MIWKKSESVNIPDTFIVLAINRTEQTNSSISAEKERRNDLGSPREVKSYP